MIHYIKNHFENFIKDNALDVNSILYPNSQILWHTYKHLGKSNSIRISIEEGIQLFTYAEPCEHISLSDPKSIKTIEALLMGSRNNPS